MELQFKLEAAALFPCESRCCKTSSCVSTLQRLCRDRRCQTDSGQTEQTVTEHRPPSTHPVSTQHTWHEAISVPKTIHVHSEVGSSSQLKLHTADCLDSEYRSWAHLQRAAAGRDLVLAADLWTVAQIFQVLKKALSSMSSLTAVDNWANQSIKGVTDSYAISLLRSCLAEQVVVFTEMATFTSFSSVVLITISCSC